MSNKPNRVKKVEGYQTSDGEVHKTSSIALAIQAEIDLQEASSSMDLDNYDGPSYEELKAWIIVNEPLIMNWLRYHGKS